MLVEISYGKIKLNIDWCQHFAYKHSTWCGPVYRFTDVIVSVTLYNIALFNCFHVQVIYF